MAPSILDYNSECPTFALAFSPLSTTTPTLKLAVGSFVEGRSEQNNLTVVGLDPAYLELEDDYDDPNAPDQGQGRQGGDDAPAYARARRVVRQEGLCVCPARPGTAPVPAQLDWLLPRAPEQLPSELKRRHDRRGDARDGRHQQRLPPPV